MHLFLSELTAFDNMAMLSKWMSHTCSRISSAYRRSLFASELEHAYPRLEIVGDLPA